MLVLQDYDSSSKGFERVWFQAPKTWTLIIKPLFLKYLIDKSAQNIRSMSPGITTIPKL